MYTEIATNYLNSFADKDVENISAVLSDSITLRDWDAEAHGKEDVLEFMTGLFAKFDTIDVEVHSVFDCRNTVIVEMTITLNDNENTNELAVTDIIEFNSESKITAIRAYLG